MADARLVVDNLTGTSLHQIAQAAIDVCAEKGTKDVDESSDQRSFFFVWQEFIEDNSTSIGLESVQGGLQAGVPIWNDRQNQVQDDGIEGFYFHE